MQKKEVNICTSKNPFISYRADPYILQHTDGVYYFTATVPEYDRITLRRANTLQELKAAEDITVWRKHESGSMSQYIWAPELHYDNGAWYIYFAAGSDVIMDTIRPHALRCADENPLSGRWEELGTIQAHDNFSFKDFSLDMTIFSHNGKRYAVWAEKVSVGKKISNLYIAEAGNPFRLKSEQVLLSSPDYDWERIGFWVNEGPAFLSYGDKLFLTYSASSTGACYCMGLLTADAGSDILDPKSWTKERYPVLKTEEKFGFFGPGHNSFFKEKDDYLIAFHARQQADIAGDPLYDPGRHTYLMKILWSDGKPVFDYNNIILY